MSTSVLLVLEAINLGMMNEFDDVYDDDGRLKSWGENL